MEQRPPEGPELDLESEPMAPESGNGAAPDSMMESLRRKHAELAEGTTLDLPIPGYGGELVARYRILDIQNELGRINVRVRQQYKHIGEVALYATVDVIATACLGIYYDDGETKRSISESIGPDEPPIKFDSRLAEFLNFEATSARETVLEVFGRNEPAILDHGRQLNLWMNDTSRSTMGDFLTEIS